MTGTLTYLYIWEKPKLEKFIVKQVIVPMTQDESFPAHIDIERLNLSIVPLRVELYNTKITPKKELAETLSPFEVKLMTVSPSIIDIIIGKLWLSLITIEGSKIEINIDPPKTAEKSPKKQVEFELNKILKRIPLSELNVQDIQLSLNIKNKAYIQTESLYLKAYNEKSSLILTLKDPQIQVKTKKGGKPFGFFSELQVMLTKDSLSLSSLKIIKDSSYFIASGNILYQGTPDNIQEMLLQTRINVDFQKLKEWSNLVHKNDYFNILHGQLKSDITISQKGFKAEPQVNLSSKLVNFQVDNVVIGDVNLDAHLKDRKHIEIKEINATLSGNNKVNLSNAKIYIDKKTTFETEVALNNTQLHTFLRESTIADIPVWLNINGNMKCQGSFEKTLNVDCPGALTVTNIDIKNKGRNKSIVKAKKVDIAGSMNITEKAISFKATAAGENSRAISDGVIEFNKGFNINYDAENVDLEKIGPLADLEFKGIAKCKGNTTGNSRTANFFIDIAAENMEFEEYFFGNLSTRLNYKVGILSFQNIAGNIESTRYNGYLNVDVIKEIVNGDIQLPFFRMEDVQTSILKKVDLQSRFLGSGSGRIRLDTPFDIDQMNFNLDARLFKGSVFGEDYNEAKLQAQAIDGIIIVQQALLQREKSIFNLKGTLDTKLKSDFTFSLDSGFLQLSTLLKEYNLPMAGEFDAVGTVKGELGNPQIKTTANIKNLFFNKGKYGEASFGFDNSNNQTNLQFEIPEQFNLLVVFPEKKSNHIFVNMDANKLDIAPVISFLSSEETTRNYSMLFTGEMSGQMNTQDFWNSEFSSTFKEIEINYKANKIVTQIPTNLELKNQQLYLNKLSLIGEKQHLTISQPYTEKFSTKFIIGAEMNIAFFKLFAPFIEKIDGRSTLRLELTLKKSDVYFQGISTINRGFLKFPGFPHAFENVLADVSFNQNNVNINSLSASMANGSVLGQGEVVFKGGKNFDLRINTDMEDINLKFPEGFNTSGRASLSLTGSGIPFKLSGEYVVTDGLIDSNFDSTGSSNSNDLLEELLKKETSTPLMVNIDIRTQRPIEVKNQMVDGYMLGNLTVYDKITRPRIRGEVHFEDRLVSNSVIRFNENEFEVTQSSFIFEGQNPINPKLSMRAQTRMNNYDIELFLQGRANKPVLTMSSQPPLPESQIVSMLALGQLPDEFEQNASTGTDPNANSNFEIGTSMLSNNPLGRELKERLDVDVQFSSTFDENTGSPVPKVNLRKKITKDLQVTASSTTGTASTQEVKASYNLNNNLSAIFGIETNPTDTTGTNTTNDNTTRQSNPIGLDLEYRLEFD